MYVCHYFVYVTILYNFVRDTYLHVQLSHPHDPPFSKSTQPWRPLFPPTTMPLFVIQAWKVTNIIIHDPTMLSWPTIYHHLRGWFTRYIEDSASADDIKIFFSAYVRRITNKRLLLAMPSQHPNVYCIVASGALHWQMWPFLFISSGRIICIKNIEFYHPPTWI